MYGRAHNKESHPTLTNCKRLKIFLYMYVQYRCVGRNKSHSFSLFFPYNFLLFFPSFLIIFPSFIPFPYPVCHPVYHFFPRFSFFYTFSFQSISTLPISPNLFPSPFTLFSLSLTHCDPANRAHTHGVNLGHARLERNIYDHGWLGWAGWL